MINKCFLSFLAFCLMTIAPIAHANPDVHLKLQEILEIPFPYTAANVDITRALNDVSTLSGTPVIVEPSLSGRLSVNNAKGTVATALAAVASQVPIVWWFDGVALHVEPQSNLRSAILSLGRVAPEELKAELIAMNLFDPRFPIHESSRGSFLRIVAPQGYVAEAKQLIAEMNTQRTQLACSHHAKDGTEDALVVAGLPLVLRGANTRIEQ